VNILLLVCDDIQIVIVHMTPSCKKWVRVKCRGSFIFCSFKQLFIRLLCKNWHCLIFSTYIRSYYRTSVSKIITEHPNIYIPFKSPNIRTNIYIMSSFFTVITDEVTEYPYMTVHSRQSDTTIHECHGNYG
jgi:hypothetical protein